MDVDAWKRHARTRRWSTPSITHAEPVTLPPHSPPAATGFISTKQNIEQGGELHPQHLICTGVHLLQVVGDNLHIMSHLHLRVHAATTEGPADSFDRRRPVCVAAVATLPSNPPSS